MQYQSTIFLCKITGWSIMGSPDNIYSLLKQKLIRTIFHSSDEWVCCVIVFGIIFAMCTRLRKSDRMPSKNCQSMLKTACVYQWHHKEPTCTDADGCTFVSHFSERHIHCSVSASKLITIYHRVSEVRSTAMFTTSIALSPNNYNLKSNIDLRFYNFEGIKHCQCHYRH